MIIINTGNSSIKDLLALNTPKELSLELKKKILIKILTKIIFIFSFFIFSLGISEERIEKITKIPPKINIIRIIGNHLNVWIVK